MDNLRYVMAGDRRASSAATQNALIDAARSHLRSHRNMIGTGPELPSAQIMVFAHREIDRFTAVKIEDHALDISANGQFQDVPVFNVSDAVQSEQFAIVLDYLAEGRMGRAVISGLAPCKVSISDETHTAVEIDEDGALVSGSTGLSRIVWKESGIGDKWCLIDVGSPVETITPDADEAVAEDAEPMYKSIQFRLDENGEPSKIIEIFGFDSDAITEFGITDILRADPDSGEITAEDAAKYFMLVQIVGSDGIRRVARMPFGPGSGEDDEKDPAAKDPCGVGGYPGDDPTDDDYPGSGDANAYPGSGTGDEDGYPGKIDDCW